MRAAVSPRSGSWMVPGLFSPATVVALALALAGRLQGQAPSPPAAAPPPAQAPADATVPEEAVRYHDMLLRRPQAGVVFDRFYDAWLGTGSVEGLKAFLEKRLSQSTATAADHLVLALFFTRRGEDEAALKSYARALEMDAGNAAAWADRARLEARVQDFEASLKSLERGIAAKPDASLLLELSKQRARHLLRLGRSDDALKAFRELIASQPDDEDLAEEVVHIQMEEGLSDEAAKGTEALISRTKDAYQKVTRLLLLGDIRQKQGHRDDAEDAYEGALELAGKDTWVEGEVLARIEQSFRREDDLEGLATKLGTLAAADPARMRLAQQHAQVLSDLGRTDEAVKVYQDLLARTPGQQAVREGFLDLLESANKLPEAIEQAKALRAQIPGEKEWIIRLASLQHQAKDDGAAQASLSEYAAASGTGESDRLRVARLLETWDLKAPARAAYESLVKAHPDSVAAREAHAQFLHRMEERDAALAIWRDIAAKGSLEDAIHVGQTLGARMEHGVALEVLLARVANSPGEPRLLAALCTAAAGAKEFSKAIPWARERVRLARDPMEVEDSVKAASMIIRNAGTAEAASKELAGLPSPTAAERCLLAELRESMKDHAGADAALAALTGPDEALGLQQQVRLLQGRQEWIRAAEIMSKLIALPDGRTSANVQKLVDLHQRAGQSSEAMTWISEWKKLSPGAVTPWMVESRLLSESGRADDAIKVLREANRKFSDNPDLAASFGDQLVAIGQMHEAMQIFETWYEKTEDIIGKMRWASSLARAAASGGGTAQLVERFRERQKKNRQSVVPWIALAEIHRASGNMEGRRNAIMEAARLRPQDLDLLMELARLQEEDGLWKEALATLETARPLDKNTKVRERQAAIQLRYGDENLGYRILFELAGGDQMDPRSIEGMADSIAARGEWERVTQFLSPMLVKYPKDYRLRYLAAVALEESGREKEAVDLFLGLIQPGEELPGVVVPEGGGSAVPRNPYQDEFLRTLPPGMDGLVELTMVWNIAYRHRQPRGSGISYGFGGGQMPTGFVVTPPYAVATPSLAAAHLISLAQSMKDTERAELAARLKRMDVPQAEMLLHLTWEPQRGGVVVEESWVEAHPEDETALAWWTMSVLNRAGRVGAMPNEALLRRSFETFRKEYPGLASLAAISAGGSSSEEAKKLFAEGVTLVSSLERMDYVAAQGILGHLQGRRMGGGPAVTISKEDEPLLHALKILLLKPDNSASPFKGWVLSSVASILSANGRWEDAMDLAQADQDQFEKNPGTGSSYAQQMRMMYGVNRGGVSVSPLPFPSALTGVSVSAIGVISPMLANNVSMPQPQDDDGPSLKDVPRNEPLLKAAPRLKHDVLRHVALLAGGDREAFTRYLEGRIQSEPESAGPILMAAWEAQQSRNHPKAVTLLQKALTFPLSATDRAMVEHALLYSAAASQTSVNGKPDPAMTAAMLDAAKEIAARHVRNTSLSQHQKQMLGHTLQTLGMMKEATQLLSPPQRATTASRASGTQSLNVGAAPSTPAMVEHLAGKDQREAAAREAARQLRVVVPELFGFNGLYARSRVDDLIEIVEKRKLAPDILKAADPGKPTSARRLLEFAGLHELLDMEMEAIALYEEVLASAPRTTEAQVRLTLLVSTRDPEAAAERLLSIKQPQALTALYQNLFNLMQSGGGNSSLAGRIAATRTLTIVIEKMAASAQKIPFEVMAQYLWLAPQSIAQPHYSNRSESGDPRLPDLYQLALYEPKDNNRLREEIAGQQTALGKERRAAHDALCRAMLGIPELSEQGFGPLAGLALAEKQDLQEIKKLAMTALDLVATTGNQARIETFAMPFHYSSGSSDRIWQPSPAELLIYAAWKENEPGRVEAEILPKLAGSGGKNSPSVLQAMAFAKLWFGKPEEFAEAAEAWGRFQVRNQGEPTWAWFSDGGLMENVLRFALERNIDIPLEDWVSGKIVAASSSNNHVDLQCLHPWLRSLAARGGTRRVVAFVDEVGTSLFGGEQERQKAMQEYVALRFAANSGQRNPGSKLYSYGQLIEGLLHQDAVPVAALMLMAREKWLENPQGAQQVRYQLDDEKMFADPAAIAELLASAPFSSEVAGFRAYGFREQGDPTVLGTLLNELRRRREPRAKVLEALKAQASPAFGLQLSIAALEEDSDARLREFVIREQGALASLSLPMQTELRSTLRQVWPALKEPGSLPEDTQKALKPLFAAELRTNEERRAQVLAAPKLEELEMKDYDFFMFLRREVLALVTARKEADAAKLFTKGCDLLEAKMAASGWSQGQNWNGWTPRSQLADDILEQRLGWDLVRFGAHLYNTDTSGKLVHPGTMDANKWTTNIVETWKQEGGCWKPQQALETTLMHLHGSMQKEPIVVLTPVMNALAAAIPQRLRPPLIAWAEQEAQARPYAHLARQFAVAARFQNLIMPGRPLQRDASGRPVPVPDLPLLRPQDWDYLRGQMLDESVNPRVRLVLANHLCFYGREEPMDSAIIRKAAGLSAEALRNSWAHSSSHLASVLRSFNQEPVDDAWKQQARALWDGWLLRNARNSESTRFGRAYQPRETAIFAMWEMTVRAREKGWQERMRKDFTGALDDSYLTFVAMVRQDDHDGALDFLRSQWLKMTQWVPFYDQLDKPSATTPVVEGYTTIRNTPAIDRFVQTCPDPAMAEFVRMTMDVGNDPAQSYRDRFGGPLEYRARRNRAVEAYNTAVFKDEVMTIHATGWVFAATKGQDKIQQALDSLPKLELDNIMRASDQQTMRWAMIIPLLESSIKAQAGDIQPFQDLYKYLHTQAVGNSHRFGAKTYAARMALSRARLFWKVQPPAKASAVLPLTSAIISQSIQSDGDEVGDAIGVRTAAHLYDGDIEGLKKWRAALSPDRLTDFKKRFRTQGSVLYTLGSMCGHEPEVRLPVERRLALMETLAKDPWFMETVQKYPADYFTLEKLVGRVNLFTLPEMLEHGMKIAAWIPREGRSFDEMADWYEKEGREKETFAALDAMVAASGGDNFVRGQALLRKAELLEILGRLPEAVESLKDVDMKKLTTIQKKRVEDLRRNAEKASKKPAP